MRHYPGRLFSDDIITYQHDSEHLPCAEFDPLEFLAAISAQIPKKWEQLTRHYGYYSTRARGERKKRQAATEPLILQPLDKKKASATWAALIKRVYEVDPLICSECGGEMKIIAFIQDSKAIADIMKSLGLPSYRAPPPLNFNTNTQFEPFYEAA